MKWIFFDIGWTLVDETGSHLGRFERLLKVSSVADKYDLAGLMALYEAAIVRFESDPFAAVLEETGVDRARRAEFPYAKEREVLYPDCKSALAALAGNVSLGVLANQSAGLPERLARFGIADSFGLVLGSADIGYSKPDVKFFEMAADRIRAQPDNIVMVGDRLDNDVAPAKRAGWRTIRILRGLHRKQTPRSSEESPDMEVDGLGEIPDLLERLFSR